MKILAEILAILVFIVFGALAEAQEDLSPQGEGKLTVVSDTFCQSKFFTDFFYLFDTLLLKWVNLDGAKILKRQWVVCVTTETDSCDSDIIVFLFGEKREGDPIILAQIPEPASKNLFSLVNAAVEETIKVILEYELNHG